MIFKRLITLILICVMTVGFTLPEVTDTTVLSKEPSSAITQANTESQASSETVAPSSAYVETTAAAIANPDGGYGSDANRYYTTEDSFPWSFGERIKGVDDPVFSYTNGTVSFMTADEKKQADAKVSEIISQIITSGMSDFQKEMAIIEYIANNVTYDSTMDTRLHQSRYGALILGKCACSGYADAFLALGQAAGLTVRMNGTYNEGAGVDVGHAWAQIRLENEWYIVDLTSIDAKSLVASSTAINRINATFASYRQIHAGNGTADVVSYILFDESKSTGTKYGSDTVKLYLITGEVVTAGSETSFLQMQASKYDYAINLSDANASNVVDAIVSDVVENGKTSYQVFIYTANKNSINSLFNSDGVEATTASSAVNKLRNAGTRAAYGVSAYNYATGMQINYDGLYEGSSMIFAIANVTLTR